MTRVFPSLICVLVGLVLSGCGPSGDDSAEADLARRQQLSAESEGFTGWGIEQLMADASAMRLAEQLYGAHCAACHGPEGGGGQGAPRLVDGVFNYGSTAAAVRATITDGRESLMPGMGNQFGEMNLGQLVAYVEALSSDEPLGRLAAQGKQLFDESCTACHGTDGRGVAEVGGPNLADDYWLHGDTMMAIRLVITRGAEGRCPPQAEVLTPAEINLLTAYVLHLNGGSI